MAFENIKENNEGEPLKYPQNFIEAVLKIFPNDEDFPEMLTSGNEMVGMALNDAANGLRKSFFERVSPEDMLNDTRVQELRSTAERLKEMDRLYVEWLKIDRERNKKTE